MSDWIEWDGSNGGHPEQLDTLVIVRFRDGKESSAQTVKWWGGDLDSSNWKWGPGERRGFGRGNADIVAYRVVENG